ncbi:MAG TPA: BON domain-containing protein [Longimicrobiaceae bacterium]|nr:BON domain-containing protein [Longimicrobiaceae bacterium]
MATEYSGDIFDLENLSDDEIRTLVIEQLQQYPNIDAGWIEVDVKQGHVTLSGRVGTDGEVQVAESVLDDVIGIDNYSNNLVVDELHREDTPEAADEAIVQDREVDEQSGEPDPQQTDTAEHLAEDLETETYGTHDMQEAIRDGTAYIPPDRPVGDGYDSREDH